VVVGVAAQLGIRPVGPGGSRTSRLGALARGPRRGVQAFAGTRPGAWVFARTLHHLDRAVAGLTRGRTTLTDVLAGLPAVQLTTTGARSGLPRTVPLLGIAVQDGLAVIGSNFGARSHPGWVHNLLADPAATVSRHNRSVAVLAREADGDEADRIWQLARRLYHGYALYPERTQGRVIRVFVLDPATRPATGSAGGG
jgi:deazaflavin-dependent oxidoreductase (nitroreductase family)